MTLARATLRVPGLHCPGCVDTVRRVVEAVGGVARVEGDLARREVTVEYDPSLTSLEGIAAVLEGIGFPPTREGPSP